MTGRSDVLKARLEQLNRRREKAHETQDPSGRSGPRPGGRVRRVVMVSFSEHMKLSRWCQTTAVELGLSRITGQEVLRTLIIRLLTDTSLANELRADLAAHRAEPRADP